MTKDTQHEDRDERRVWSKIDLVKLSAGTLAAVSSAVCASWLGVTGTIVGAALASVVATVGQELYAHSLKHTYKRLRGVRLEQALAAVGATGPVATRAGRPAPASAGAAMASGGLPGGGSGGIGGGTATALDDQDEAGGSRVSAEGAALGLVPSEDRGTPSGTAGGPSTEEPAASEAAPGTGRATAERDGRAADGPHRSGRAHWARLALAAVAMFVFAMLLISAFELIVGDSLAGLFGDDSAGATTVPFGGGDPAPEVTPVPPIETVPADPASTTPAGTPQSSAPAETPAATDPAPSSGTAPEPELTTDPATPPDTGDDAPAEQAPAPAGDGDAAAPAAG